MREDMEEGEGGRGEGGQQATMKSLQREKVEEQVMRGSREEGPGGTHEFVEGEEGEEVLCERTVAPLVLTFAELGMKNPFEEGAGGGEEEELLGEETDERPMERGFLGASHGGGFLKEIGEGEGKAVEGEGEFDAEKVWKRAKETKEELMKQLEIAMAEQNGGAEGEEDEEDEDDELDEEEEEAARMYQEKLDKREPLLLFATCLMLLPSFPDMSRTHVRHS